ncbi:MAG: sugar phosphate nucleotidyltransferase [Verrucomicrobiales bacterium]|nr:sugar phosphate nucleotidyltransferase [Verrucomicrobiales bacterium]
MNKAFVLGAGLGSRLKKLTEELPKPMIPVFGKPLIEYTFDHLNESGINQFIVNTHHCAKAYTNHFKNNHYKKTPITFRHEPVLLDTGGGIDNVSELLSPDPFLVYNGDILTDLPIINLLNHHTVNKNIVTLALRTNGAGKHIALNSNAGKVTDIKNLLNSGNIGNYQFTGIYACNPQFLNYLQHKEKHSVIPVFLKLIQEKLLGGIVIDDGNWWDMGTRTNYLEAHQILSESKFPNYLTGDKSDFKRNHSKESQIAPDAKIDRASYIGKGASIGSRANIINSIIWPNSKVTPDSQLVRCVVRHGRIATGKLENIDI